MPHDFQFNYRITEEKLSKLTVEGFQRQEKNLVFSFVNSLMYLGFEIPLHRACAI